jgi:hypothetical protein
MHDFLQQAVDFAQQAYKSDPELDGSIILSVQCPDEANNATWAIPVPGNLEDKDIMIKMATMIIHGRNATSYTISSLGWMAKLDNADDIGRIRPSQALNKQETLIVAHVVKDVGTQGKLFLVNRLSENEAITGFEASEEATKGVFGRGTLTGFFDIPQRVIDHPDLAKLAATTAEKIFEQFLVVGKRYDPEQNTLVENSGRVVN